MTYAYIPVDDHVIIVDPGLTPHPVPLGVSGATAVSANMYFGRVYVIGNDPTVGGWLTVLDPTSDPINPTVTTVLTGLGQVISVLISSDETALYIGLDVTTPMSGVQYGVFVINPKTFAFISGVELPGPPMALAAHPTLDKIYISVESADPNIFEEMNPSTDSVDILVAGTTLITRNLTAPQPPPVIGRPSNGSFLGPYGLAVSRNGTSVFAPMSQDVSFNTSTPHLVVVMDTTSTALSWISVPAPMWCAATDPHNTFVYITNQRGGVFAIDMSTHAVLTIPIPDAIGSAYAIQVTPDGMFVYVTDNGAQLFIISTATKTVVSSVVLTSFVPTAVLGTFMKEFKTIYDAPPLLPKILTKVETDNFKQVAEVGAFGDPWQTGIDTDTLASSDPQRQAFIIERPAVVGQTPGRPTMLPALCRMRATRPAACRM